MAAKFDSAGTQVLRPATLAHIFLRTNKFGQMVDFYKTILSAEAAYESSKIAFLSFDHEHHRIAIAALPDTGDKVRSSAGLEHVAFTYNSLDELALAYRQRKNLGIEPTWCVNHGITTSIYYQDPDGNNIETQVDNFDDNNDATAFMMTECFKRNPVGIDFDPEDLVRRLESGEDQASIKQRPDAKQAASEVAREKTM